MKRKLAILTVVSGAMFCLMLVLLPVSYCLESAKIDEKSGQWTSPCSIRIAPGAHCGIFDGGVWFFNLQVPYTGSMRSHGVNDKEGTFWAGGRAHYRRHWSWRAGACGFFQVSYIGDKGEFVGRDVFGDLPGIYYRHFVWWKEPTWWTLRVSFWYPIIFFGVLPALWLIRQFRMWLNDTSLAKLLNKAASAPATFR